MMTPVESVSVYLSLQPVDFRRGLRSLTAYVEAELGQNPFARSLYLFTNRQHNRIRILYWDRTGFCLWTKVLEKARFHWPDDERHQTLTTEQLRWLLEGYDISQMTPHPALEYQTVL